MKSLKWGGYIYIVIALMHFVGLIWADQMYEYTGVGDNMRRNALINPHLPTLITIIVSVFFFIFGLYGLSGAKVIRRLPKLKLGIITIALIYLGRGTIGSVINIWFETSFIWYHLLFSVCAFIIGLLYLIGFYKIK